MAFCLRGAPLAPLVQDWSLVPTSSHAPHSGDEQALCGPSAWLLLQSCLVHMFILDF